MSNVKFFRKSLNIQATLFVIGFSSGTKWNRAVLTIQQVHLKRFLTCSYTDEQKNGERKGRRETRSGMKRRARKAEIFCLQFGGYDNNGG
jgi:hypothetical protein